MKIRPIQEGELNRLGRFRYEIYVEEMQRIQLYADHDHRVIIDPLDEGATNFIAEQNGSIVGTVRVNFPRDTSVGDYESFYAIPDDSYMREATSITTRLMVSPRLRGGSLPLRLALTAYEFGLRNGILFDHIDCNDHLRSFFFKLGYEEMFRKNHAEYGDVTCLVLRLRDRKRLSNSGSPFLKALDAFDQSKTFNQIEEYA